MFLITILAKPTLENNEAKEISGAYVNCWINFQLQDGAILLAKYYVEQENWFIEKIDEISWVAEDEFEDDRTALDYFR
jgi:hypothetical protein